MTTVPAASTSKRPDGWRLAALLGLVAFGDEAFSISLPLVLLTLGASVSAPVLIHGALYTSLVISGFMLGGVVDRYETYWVVRRCWCGANKSCTGFEAVWRD